MLYSKVYLKSFGYELPPNVVTSADLEKRLEPVYDALHFQQGQLEAITGIRERRFWDPGFKMHDGAVKAGRKALEVSGISRPQGIPKRPQQYPVRIHKMFPPEKYDVIKKDIFRIHFQYVMAGELQTDYDFFAITGGPIKLASRYPEASSTI